MMVTIDQSVYSTSTLSKDLLLNIWVFALFCVGPGGHNWGHPGEGGGGWEGGGEGERVWWSVSYTLLRGKTATHNGFHSYGSYFLESLRL